VVYLAEVDPMPRKLRLEYEGAIYHLMSRGDRREAIFKNDFCCVAKRLWKNYQPFRDADSCQIS